MRKLAIIQKISGVKPIIGADAIELVLIMGWQCVSKKNEFKQGDLCVYFEVDSFLPVDERYEFLRKTSYRNNEFMGEGFRIKTITLRGELSQGLALPLSAFPEISKISKTAEISAGDDVTELLSVRKWEMPEVAGSSGIEIGNKPFGIPTTDETRIQSMTEFIGEFKNKPYYITTKMDGTSCTVYIKDGKVGVCGRNMEYKEDAESCAMWAWVYKTGLKEKLITLGEDIAIQGEFCGEGIQKNPLKLMEPNLFVFDIMDLGSDGYIKKHGFDGIKNYCVKLGLEMVPVEETGDAFDYTLEELLDKAKGQYPSGRDKEGIVIRTREYGRSDALQHKMSFKVINNDFLKKEKD